MPSLAGIQAKIDNASRKYNVKDRDIYKRITSVQTINSMLEAGSSVSVTDILLDPQPFYIRPDYIALGALRAPDDVISADGNAALPNAEYVMFCSPNCLSVDDLHNPNLTIVFKDVQSNEEEFRICDYETVPFQFGTAGIEIFIKSFKKQNGTTLVS